MLSIATKLLFSRWTSSSLVLGCTFAAVSAQSPVVTPVSGQSGMQREPQRITRLAYNQVPGVDAGVPAPMPMPLANLVATPQGQPASAPSAANPSLPASAPAPTTSLTVSPSAYADIGTPLPADCLTPVCRRGWLGRRGPYTFLCQLRTPATVPPPLGSSLTQILDMQRAAALGEYFVLFMEDWIDDTAELNDSGKRHFRGIYRRLNQGGDPIYVESIGNDDVDNKRKETIVNLLIQGNYPQQDAVTRVRIGGSRAEGLRERQMEGVYLRSPSGPGGVGGNGGGGGGGGIGGFGGLGGFGSGLGGYGGTFR